ncbi:MAG: V-type ATPase subunit [Gammaproteobacteria bacterium]|nr:V-type ATPase subunit [Gammaproteobacteria bacterium]
MSAPISHTYLRTRVSVMAEQLYSPQHLEALFQTPLEHLGQGFSFDQFQNRELSSTTLNRMTEKALIRTLIHELAVLLRPLESPSRSILVNWIRKFELYNLKAIIRGKLQKLSFEQIKEDLHELPGFLALPHEGLLRTESVLELLRQLEEGTYSDIARQARRVYEEKNEPFSLDAAIDRSYYTGLLRCVNSSDGSDKSSLHELLGALIDQQNLIWLLRYRFGYGLSASETYFLLIPAGWKLYREHVKELVNKESFEQVIKALKGHYADLLVDVDNVFDAECVLESHTAVYARHCLRFSSSAVARALAYLVLREMDLKKLYAIIQGKLLQLDDGLIRTAAMMGGPGTGLSHHV